MLEYAEHKLSMSTCKYTSFFNQKRREKMTIEKNRNILKAVLLHSKTTGLYDFSTYTNNLSEKPIVPLCITI